jgi:hypothetical protein
MAGVFDTVHHIAEEMTHTHAYHFGKRTKTKSSTHHEVHVHVAEYMPLWGRLLHRFSSELMVLGFLAFVVWSCAQADVFVGIADSFKDYDDFAVPKDALSYFHTVEAVHMHMFIAMVLYFMVCGASVFYANRRLVYWEQSSDAILEGYAGGAIKPGELLLWGSQQEGARKRFAYLRHGFLTALEGWRGKWAFFDEAVAEVIPDASRLTEELEPFFPIGPVRCIELSTLD